MNSKSEKQAEASAITMPLTLLENSNAKTYTHIHPFLVLGLLYFQFGAIVDDPVRALTWLLPVVCTLQMIYAVVCVPLTTGAKSTNISSISSQSVSKKQEPGPGLRRKQQKQSGSFLQGVIPAILSAILSLFAATPVLAALLVLHGAPLTTHIPQTILAAAHFGLLSTLPLFYAYGVDGGKWRAIASLSAPVDELIGAAIGVFVGAWLGAIPIPLDWDREWQKWPVTIVAGGYAGWAAGKLLGATLFRGSSVRFDD